jgi:hypothetical protein
MMSLEIIQRLIPLPSHKVQGPCTKGSVGRVTTRRLYARFAGPKIRDQAPRGELFPAPLHANYIL